MYSIDRSFSGNREHMVTVTRNRARAFADITNAPKEAPKKARKEAPKKVPPPPFGRAFAYCEEDCGSDCGTERPSGKHTCDAAPYFDASVHVAPGDEAVKVKKTCMTIGCTRTVVSKQLCFKHGGGRHCAEKGCDDKAESRVDFCWKHGGGGE